MHCTSKASNDFMKHGVPRHPLSSFEHGPIKWNDSKSLSLWRDSIMKHYQNALITKISLLYLRYLSDSTSRLYVSNTHLCIYILELGFHNWKTGCVLRDMDLDDKAQNIVRLVDDNTLAKTDVKSQIRVLFFDR